MKSINFTKLKNKLVSGEKTQTIRCLFIPSFSPGEIVLIKFYKKPLFQAKITEIFPKLIKDITEKEAKLDGFSNKLECLHCLKELNNLKHFNRYCFIIRFKPIETMDLFIYQTKKRLDTIQLNIDEIYSRIKVLDLEKNLKILKQGVR